jgi:hypothetical protein
MANIRSAGAGMLLRIESRDSNMSVAKLGLHVHSVSFERDATAWTMMFCRRQ